MGGNIDAGNLALNVLSGGLVGAVKRASQPGGSGGTAGLLSLLTAGTSEVKTGTGQYGDETLADTLFPKVFNDMAQPDRQAARQAKDAADAAAKAKIDAEKPPPTVDLTDMALSAARKSARLRQMTGYGRSATFSNGGQSLPSLGY